MMNRNNSIVSDLNYQEYQTQQWNAITPEYLLHRVNHITPSGYYQYCNHQWAPLPYYGFGMISFLDHLSQNVILSKRLVALQQQLVRLLEEESSSTILDRIYLLPENSFHQTIANALSNKNFDRSITEKGYEERYLNFMQEVLQEYVPTEVSGILNMKIIGLSIFGNALGVLGVFEDPLHYEAILHFRNYFYEHPISNLIGIQQTRPFIGHITLAYLESEWTEKEKNVLFETVNKLNKDWIAAEQFMFLSSSQLTSFQNLSLFQPIQDVQTISFQR